MYGERAGCLSVVTGSELEAEKILACLKGVQRRMCLYPPIHGARIVGKVLGNDELRESWKQDLIKMSSRIKNMR